MGRIIFDIDGPIASVMLDSPKNHNAVDAQMRKELTEAYETIEKDDSIRVAVIGGAGNGSFCAGGSIDGYLEGNALGPDASPLPRIPRPYPSTKPYIAAIRGFALGGGFALALSCDLRVAGRGAAMGPTGLKFGAVQGAQTISRLTRLIGLSKATEVLLLSKRVTGEEAGRIGLAQAVTDDEEVFNTAFAWARTIAEFSPWAVSATKKLIYGSLDVPLEESIAREDTVASEAYRRPEVLAAFTAFKKK